jgi:hypothetical protein
MQVRWVRRRTPILPEIAEPRQGEDGDGPHIIRLLILGDSAAAGVGAGTSGQSLAGQLVTELQRDHRVAWQVWAKSGATTRSTLAALIERPSVPFDAVVISLGVNDVTAGFSQSYYLDLYGHCVSRLRLVHGVSTVIVSGFPPVGQFPALPHPLRWVLGQRCRKFDRALQVAFASVPGMYHLHHGTMGDISVMSSDGYHPGPPVYADWAAKAAAFIRSARGRV